METQTHDDATTTRTKPTHRAWLVQDRTDGRKPDWTELSGLWPLKSGGKGLSGRVDTPVAIKDGKLVGRIVILPAKDTPRR